MEITSLVVVALQITTRDATDSALVAEKVIKKITRSLRSLDDFFGLLFRPLVLNPLHFTRSDL